ncbi:Rab effector Noc2 [Folsomia candida]|uniref:Rab effector Noc2 n=1 Tax=Folsomia candida TaxID=158441 RepID=A0A226F524_FOLCA|nr:Rab effector Noc2 [Folsomia candida]
MKWTSLLLPRVEMDNSRTRFPRDFHPPSPSGNSSRFTPATSKMSSSSSSPSHSDFGLRGPKTPWVCPNDRQLALRAKLRTGWSVKTSQFNTYPKPQPLTESEQQMIISVVKKAEELDLNEQKRVGKLVDRLESLKRLASGNGVTECILCGDSFGLSVFGRSNYRCFDCKKAVCRKCVVELSTSCGIGNAGGGSPGPGSSKDGMVRLCKICSENRELIKRSGAWFYKGVPKYILPEKKNHMYRNNYEMSSSSSTMANSGDEQRYMSRYLNSYHAINNSTGSTNATTTSSSSAGSGSSKRMGVLWSRSLRSQSECENDSSSGDETIKGQNETGGRVPSSSSKFTFRRFNNSTDKLGGGGGGGGGSTNSASTPSPSPLLGSNNGSKSPSQKFHPSPGSGNGNGGGNGGGDLLFENASDASTSNSDGGGGGDSGGRQRNRCSSFSERFLATDPIPFSSSSCSTNQMDQTTTGCDNTSPRSFTESGTGCALINNGGGNGGEGLTPMDIDDLADAYCLLKLIPARFQGGHHRTKTVHKTLNPIFNETVTFYGLPLNQLAWQTLQINVIDDDRWARDCLGFASIPLHRIRPQQTRSFNLLLESGKLISTEDKEWGRLLLSLSYLSEKNTLCVGLVQATDLPTWRNLNSSSSPRGSGGGSDPFVKVRLVHDTNLGQVSASFNPSSRKYKAAVKWSHPDHLLDDFNFKVSILDLPRGLVLSYSSKGDRLKHWSDMLHLPNTKHTQWHALSPLQIPAAAM